MALPRNYRIGWCHYASFNPVLDAAGIQNIWTEDPAGSVYPGYVFSNNCRTSSQPPSHRHPVPRVHVLFLRNLAFTWDISGQSTVAVPDPTHSKYLASSLFLR